MSIKKVKPTSKSGYKQGYYKPKFPLKYRGGDPIIYRSSWERKFCHWCDHNEDVIYWISEPFSIPYFSLLDNKWHKYYPDFFFKMKKGDTTQEYVVEINQRNQKEKQQKH